MDANLMLLYKKLRGITLVLLDNYMSSGPRVHNPGTTHIVPERETGRSLAQVS